MSAKADHEGQIEISGYPLKIRNIKYVAAIDIGGDMCIAVGGDDVVQLVLCSGSSTVFLQIQHRTLLDSPDWRIVGTIDRPPPTAFSGAQPVDVTSLSWYKGVENQLILVASYVYHGVV